jgi:hypothetical protein
MEEQLIVRQPLSLESQLIHTLTHPEGLATIFIALSTVRQNELEEKKSLGAKLKAVIKELETVQGELGTVRRVTLEGMTRNLENVQKKLEAE